MAHTPGPWKVADRFYILMDDSIGCEVAKVCDDNIDDDMLGQCDADARLIAAAPELLSACKAVANDLERLLDGDDFSGLSDEELFAGFLRALLPAINKAEGRSE